MKLRPKKTQAAATRALRSLVRKKIRRMERGAKRVIGDGVVLPPDHAAAKNTLTTLRRWQSE